MKDFFSPEDFEKFPPCGMYSITHIIVALICFIVIALLCYKFKKVSKNKLIVFIRVSAIVLTILESIKIGYNFYYGYTKLINWLPLSFCSLFIYALYISGFCKGEIQKIGLSFLSGGGIVCGTTFLLMPTTSLTLHPMFHYLSVYSMLFHSLMIFVGVIVYSNNMIEINKKGYKYYLIFSGIFIFIALIVNIIVDENLMFLMYPLNIPIEFLHTIANNALPIYVVGAISIYLIIPYFGSLLIFLIIKKLKNKY